jgi:tetratricopeptide (TPR) repeat protein
MQGKSDSTALAVWVLGMTLAFLLAMSPASSLAQSDEESAYDACMYGKGEAGVKSCEKALRQNSKDRWLYLAFGKIYEGMGQYQKALQVYERGVRAIPDDQEIRGRRSLVKSNLAERAQLAESKKNGNRGAGGAASSSVKKKLERIQCLRMKGKSALTHCTKALTYFPKDAEILAAKGDALAELGKIKQAVAAYRKALRYKPGDESLERKLAAYSKAKRLAGSSKSSKKTVAKRKPAPKKTSVAAKTNKKPAPKPAPKPMVMAKADSQASLEKRKKDLEVKQAAMEKKPPQKDSKYAAELQQTRQEIEELRKLLDEVKKKQSAKPAPSPEVSVSTLAGDDYANERRVALVIGNADYKIGRLRNPVNDARDISKVLEGLGFDVDLHTNVDQVAMEKAVRGFGKKLQKGGIGLFYFAGHGVQVDGTNYLIPLHSEIKTQMDVKYKAMNAGYVLDYMEQADNKLNIVVLDACRDNPLPKGSRSAGRGLARVDGPLGSIIAYATAPGNVAEDGRGRNGVYTKHLLKQIKQPNVPIELMFKRVRIAVEQETSGRQTPWESSSLRGDFYFASK